MKTRNDSSLNQFTEKTRAVLLEAFEHTVLLDYVEGGVETPLTASRLGGKPFSENLDWPLDKNRKAMQFWAQINFRDLGGLNHCPADGILMLFVSQDYQSFRAKDQSWYRLVYKPEVAENGSVDLASPAQFALAAEQFEYLPDERLKAVLQAIQPEDKSAVEAWLKDLRVEFKERGAGRQQVLGMDSDKAREAVLMAAFHANGITFDQARKTDPHYSHLVDAASQWLVFWRLGGLHRLFPSEKRDLFICIAQEDLIKSDFLRCSPVFL